MSTIKKIRAVLASLGDAIRAQAVQTDDPHRDGTGNDSRAPTGDDYNDLRGLVVAALREIENMPTPERGRLWWIADTPQELARLLTRYTSKGATVISVDAKRDAPRIHYVFELDKARALDILGYTPGSEEWLIGETGEQ